MSVMNILLYLVAGFFYIIGCLYIIAVFVAPESIVYASDYLGIGLWIFMSFLFGSLLIWYARRRLKREKQNQPTMSIEQVISSPLTSEPAFSAQPLMVKKEKKPRSSLAPVARIKEPIESSDKPVENDDLKLRYALGEITKEDYEQKKQQQKKE